MPVPTTLATHGRDPASRPGRDPFAGLDRVAWLMDRAIRVPGTNLRFGLDALLGLIPFGGDLAMGAIQAGLIGVALLRYGAPPAVALRMVLNVLIDMGVGAIPIVGDLFDFVFKANTRNVELLRQAQTHHLRGEPMPAGPSRRVLLGIGLALLAAFAALVALLVVLLLGLIRLLSGHPLL